MLNWDPLGAPGVYVVMVMVTCHRALSPVHPVSDSHQRPVWRLDLGGSAGQRLGPSLLSSLHYPSEAAVLVSTHIFPQMRDVERGKSSRGPTQGLPGCGGYLAICRAQGQNCFPAILLFPVPDFPSPGQKYLSHCSLQIWQPGHCALVCAFAPLCHCSLTPMPGAGDREQDVSWGLPCLESSALEELSRSWQRQLWAAVDGAGSCGLAHPDLGPGREQ